MPAVNHDQEDVKCFNPAERFKYLEVLEGRGIKRLVMKKCICYRRV